MLPSQRKAAACLQPAIPADRRSRSWMVSPCSIRRRHCWPVCAAAELVGMREHRQARRFELGTQQRSGTAFGNEKTFSLRSAEGKIGGTDTGAGDDAVERLGRGRQSPYGAEAGVTDQEIAAVVQCEAIGAARTAMQMREDADLRG